MKRPKVGFPRNPFRETFHWKLHVERCFSIELFCILNFCQPSKSIFIHFSFRGFFSKDYSFLCFLFTVDYRRLQESFERTPRRVIFRPTFRQQEVFRCARKFRKSFHAQRNPYEEEKLGRKALYWRKTREKREEKLDEILQE